MEPRERCQPPDLYPYVSTETYANMMGYDLDKMIRDRESYSSVEPEPNPASCGFEFD